MLSFGEYQNTRRRHWQTVAKKMQHWKGWGGGYSQRLSQVYQNLIPQGMRVLELGCGQGDLLASLKPAFGIGIDFSHEMIRQASRRHPDCLFIITDAQELCLDTHFDFIILSDLINDLWDVQSVLEQLQPLCQPSTRIILNTYSRVWQLPLKTAETLGVAKPNLEQNWFTVGDISSLLHLTDFDTLRNWHEVLFPVNLPIISSFFNKGLAHLWPFNLLSMTNFVLARPCLNRQQQDQTVTVLVPARNEEGNIQNIIARTPEMGRGTELLFVEGNSTDQTWAAIEKAIQENPDRNIRLLKQPGKGKGDAVRTGFGAAKGDILMILDADLTVPPEDLPRFYKALQEGKGEFINGVRLVYPMEDRAMRPLNFLGNKAFSMAFSWLFGQPIKDTLCGTKVLKKDSYERIAANRSYFGEFDPFGDFDLLFGAARQNMKIVDLPVRYRERTYGTTNIQRWKHGWLLIKMVFFALNKLKFI